MEVEDQAWVTLATNDTYALGALVLAHSLIQVGTARKLVVLVTPGVTSPMRSHLSSVFDLVQEVNVLDSSDSENLALLSRPDLGITFTKLHCWRLTQFKKCVFMDADTLVLQNCDELFDREELSAAPDVGWPDCFNSGVFVYRPADETYRALVQCALTTGSFDGGDQGLLNMFFGDWATKDIAKHLPFVYNMTSSVAYTYLPAYQHFAKDVKVVHFIGPIKPWNHHYNAGTSTVEPHPAAFHSLTHLQSWWNVFVRDVKPNLQEELTVETKYFEGVVQQAGLAGYLSQLSLGAGDSSEQKSLEDRARQFAWEQGQIDFMGADSFDNIQKKLDATLASTDVVTTDAAVKVDADAEKSAVSAESQTPNEAIVASVVSEEISGTQTAAVQSSGAPVLTAPIAVSSSAVGATVSSSALSDSSQTGDVKSPSLVVAIPPAAPVVPKTVPSTPPIPLPPPPAVPATPPTTPIPFPPPITATTIPATLPVASAVPVSPVESAIPVIPAVKSTIPGTPTISPATPATPPVVAAALATPPVVPTAPATPPVAPAAPATPPVVPTAPATPPVAPAAPATPPVVPTAPATPPVVPTAPATPPVVPTAPATPPVVPTAPATPPVVPTAPATPPVVPAVSSVPSIPVAAAKSPIVPSTPPVATETTAPPVPPRIPTTPPVASAVPSTPSPAAPQAKIVSSPKGASPTEVPESGGPGLAAAAAAVAEESAPKAAGGKKSAPKSTPSAPVRKSEKGKPSKK